MNEFIARNGIISKSNLVVSGSLTALSSIVAQTLVVQTITSSISSITGSTNFGSLAANTHTFTGSMSVSGSVGIIGALTLNSAGNNIRSGNELRFYRADNGIYTRIYDAGALAANGFILDNTNAEGFHFQNNGTTIMRMNSAGNVGIGTTTPNGLLSLKASLSDTPVLRFQNNITSGLDAALSTFVSAAQTYLTIGTNCYVNSSGNVVRFNTSYESSFIAFDEGNLRFATGTTSTTPSTKLTIASGGNATFSAAVRAANFGIERASAFRGGLYTYDAITGTGTDYGITMFAEGGTNNGNIYFCVNGSVTKAMTITTGGTVLINRTTVASITGDGSLQVGKEIISTGTSAFIGLQNRASTNFFGFYGDTSLYIYNSAIGIIGTFASSTGTYTPSSDINRKKDFENSTIGLDAVMNLKPTLYRMKDEDETTKKHLGFIAQEVKDYIPQAYVETGDDENVFIGLSEMPIIAALTKAIQELTARVQELENK